MILSRRTILKAAAALPLAAGNLSLGALAQTAVEPGAAEIPPIMLVHGNSDHAALWITTLWRMESNGVPRGRMSAINFTDPLARADDKIAQPNRSSTDDQRRELGAAVAELKHQRDERGLSLSDVSERSGLDRALLSRLENGTILNPTMATLWLYADAIGARVSLTVEPLAVRTNS